jgi:hypothetical protein
MPPSSFFLGYLTDLYWLVFMSGYKMDLNQLLPEFDLDFIDLEAVEPTFFTQKESAVAVWGSNDRLLGPCASNNLDVAAVHAQVGDISNPCDSQYVAPAALFAEEKACMV